MKHRTREFLSNELARQLRELEPAQPAPESLIKLMIRVTDNSTGDAVSFYKDDGSWILAATWGPVPCYKFGDIFDLLIAVRSLMKKRSLARGRKRMVLSYSATRNFNSKYHQYP